MSATVHLHGVRTRQSIQSQFLFLKNSIMELNDYIIRKATVEDCAALHQLIQVGFVKRF